MSNNAANSATSPNIKVLNSVIGNTAANTIKNTAANAANTIKNTATNAANTLKNTATNAVNAMANSFKSVQTNMANATNDVTNSATNVADVVADSVKESVSAVPSPAPSLSFSLPLILGIGLLIIAFVLIIYYRSTIQNSITKAYNSMTNMMNPPPPPPPPVADVNTVNKILPTRKTVYNVNSNKYTYSDAEPLCKALGAELATYDQVKQAWDQGADWCNYGWVKGQAAVYPTQKSTYDALQLSSTDDERMACGAVGVNGGYMDNPEVRFGVNCYGEKPSETAHDLKTTNELMQPPLTPSALKQKVKELHYKSEANLIGLLPFNQNQW